MLIVFHSAKIRTGQSGLSDPTIEERTWKGGSKLCGFLFSRCSVNGGKKRNKNGATERMAGRNEHADMCIPCELVWKKKSCLSGGGGVVQLLLPISCVFSTQKGNIKKKKKHKLLLQVCQLSGSSTAHGWIRAKAPHTLLPVIKEKRGGCCCCGWVEGGVGGRPNRESQTLPDSLFVNENRVYVGPVTAMWPDLKLLVMGR